MKNRHKNWTDTKLNFVNFQTGVKKGNMLKIVFRVILHQNDENFFFGKRHRDAGQVQQINIGIDHVLYHVQALKNNHATKVS